MHHDSTTTDHPFPEERPSHHLPIVLPGGLGRVGPNAIAAFYAIQVARMASSEMTVRELSINAGTSEYLLRRGIDDLVQAGYLIREARYDSDGARLANHYTPRTEVLS